MSDRNPTRNPNRSAGPTRRSDSLADVVEMLLDKGIVINADVAVSIGDTQLLGIRLRAALASFETAAKYGLEFPEGTDPDRIQAAIEGTGEGEAVEPNVGGSTREMTAPVADEEDAEREAAGDEEAAGESESDERAEDEETEETPEAVSDGDEG